MKSFIVQQQKFVVLGFLDILKFMQKSLKSLLRHELQDKGIKSNKGLIGRMMMTWVYVELGLFKQKVWFYLDRGFDLISEPDASLPLLLDAMNDDLSLPGDGLGTRFLPA